MKRSLILLIAFASRLAAQQPDSTRDTLHFVLTPLQVNAVRERSAPPPVPNVDIPAPALRATPSANQYDLMRRVVGLEVHEQGQGPGFASDVVVRGFTSDHSQDVLLIVDDVPVNLPVSGHAEGYANWNILIPAAISSARLLYGTASPLYGDFALGGVMEVFTAPEAAGTAAGLTTSSFGDMDGWLRTGGHADNGGHLEALDLRSMRGWRDNSDSRSGNVLLRGWTQHHTGRLEGGLNAYRATWHSPGFLSLSQFTNGDMKAAADPTDGGDESRVVAHGRFVHTLSPRTSLQLMGWGLLSRWNLFLTISEDPAAAPEQTHEIDRRGGAGAQAELSSSSDYGDFTLGLSARRDIARFDHGPSVRRATGALEESFDANYDAAAGYARWRRNLSTHLGVDVGARFDAIRHSSLDLLDAGAMRISNTETVLSPKLGARYNLTRGFVLTASVSRGFRSAVGAIEDPARPLILAWSTDAGVHRWAGPFHMFLGFFRLDVSNERQLDPVTRAIANTGSSRRQGVDARFDWTASDRLAVRLAYTYNDAQLSGFFPDEHAAHGDSAPLPTEAIDQHQVPGVAKYFGSIRGEWRPLSRLTLTADWRFNGPYVPIGEAGVETKAYKLLDVGGSLSVGRDITLDAVVENAGDARYAELRASGFINPGAPRTLRVGVRKGI